jgi:hypothetical protein
MLKKYDSMNARYRKSGCNPRGQAFVRGDYESVSSRTRGRTEKRAAQGGEDSRARHAHHAVTMYVSILLVLFLAERTSSQAN